MLIHILWLVNTGWCVFGCPVWKIFVCVHSTHFRCTVWKVTCFCPLYTFLMYILESVLFLFTVHISDISSGKCSVYVHSNISHVTPGKCSVSVYSTHFGYTVWKVFCSCAQYKFTMYRQESVFFLFTVHISEVPHGMCSVFVHNTHFWCTVWKVFCFCAQYTFHIFHSTHLWFTVWKVFCLCAQ